MAKNCILMSNFMLELSYCLKERLAFNITNSSTYFNNSNLHIVRRVITIESALDFVSNVWNNLNCSSAKISTAFFLKNCPVYFTSCHIRILIKAFVNESFIVSKVKICLCSIISYKYFTMLYWVHCSWININVWVKLLHCNFEPPGFKQAA